MDTTPETTDEPTTPEETPQETPEVNDDKSGTISLEDYQALKEEARKWEKRSKENYEKLQQLEKENPKAKSLEERLANLEAENLLLKKESISNAYKIPEAFRDRLKGNTAEEIEADAKALSELLNTMGTTKTAPGENPESPRKTLPLPQGTNNPAPVVKYTSKEDMLKASKKKP